MYLPDFEFYKPESIQEAIEILNNTDSVAPIAGGTDILVEIKQKARTFDNLVSLNYINELKGISEDDKNVYIGPCSTHTEISESPIVKKYIPALVQAVNKIGTPQVRNTGTIGGNLCTCASCSDTAPILMAYNAELEIGSTERIKLLKMTDFLVYHHQTILNKGDLLIRIIVPKPAANTGASYHKFGLRESASISVASVAAVLTVENNLVEDANIVVGASAPTPIKCPRAYKDLINRDINDLKDGSVLIKRIAEAAATDTFPIDDIRGSADYRRDIVKTLTKRAILEAISNISK